MQKHDNYMAHVKRKNFKFFEKMSMEETCPMCDGRLFQA